MSNRDYAEWKLRDDEKGALLALSQKNYDPKKRRIPNPFKGSVSVVMKGFVDSLSGYLAVCEPNDITDYKGSPFDLIFRQSVPELVQSEQGVVFGNSFGDGVFGVFSDSQRRFYVETEPNYGAKYLAQIAMGVEQHDEKEFTLEGVVGVGGGIMAIVDPEVRPLSEPDYNLGDYFAILRTGKGRFECSFNDNQKWLVIEKKRS